MMDKSGEELDKECAEAAKAEQYQHQCRGLKNRARYYTKGEGKRRNNCFREMLHDLRSCRLYSILQNNP